MCVKADRDPGGQETAGAQDILTDPGLMGSGKAGKVLG